MKVLAIRDLAGRLHPLQRRYHLGVGDFSCSFSVAGAWYSAATTTCPDVDKIHAAIWLEERYNIPKDIVDTVDIDTGFWIRECPIVTRTFS